MGNMNIIVSKEKFISMSPEERDWVIWEGIMHMDKYGCNYAKKTYRRLYGIAAITGFIGGFVAVMARIIIKWFEFL